MLDRAIGHAALELERQHPRERAVDGGRVVEVRLPGRKVGAVQHVVGAESLDEREQPRQHLPGAVRQARCIGVVLKVQVPGVEWSEHEGQHVPEPGDEAAVVVLAVAVDRRGLLGEVEHLHREVQPREAQPHVVGGQQVDRGAPQLVVRVPAAHPGALDHRAHSLERAAHVGDAGDQALQRRIGRVAVRLDAVELRRREVHLSGPVCVRRCSAEVGDQRAARLLAGDHVADPLEEIDEPAHQGLEDGAGGAGHGSNARPYGCASSFSGCSVVSGFGVPGAASAATWRTKSSGFGSSVGSFGTAV